MSGGRRCGCRRREEQRSAGIAQACAPLQRLPRCCQRVVAWHQAVHAVSAVTRAAAHVGSSPPSAAGHPCPSADRGMGAGRRMLGSVRLCIWSSQHTAPRHCSWCAGRSPAAAVRGGESGDWPCRSCCPPVGTTAAPPRSGPRRPAPEQRCGAATCTLSRRLITSMPPQTRPKMVCLPSSPAGGSVG